MKISFLKYIVIFVIISICFFLGFFYFKDNIFLIDKYEKRNSRLFENVISELNKRNIFSFKKISIYPANFTNMPNIEAPYNDDGISIVWLGSISNFRLDNLDKYDYVFASTPLLNDFLKNNNINTFYVPLGSFDDEIKVNKNNDESFFGIIGNPLYVKEVLLERGLNFKIYNKNDKIINDIDKLRAVFVEDTALNAQSLDLHPIFFKLAYHKVPIATYWGWPHIVENINMFNDYISFYMEKDDLEILLDEMLSKHNFITNRSDFLYKLVNKEYSLRSIVDRIEYILRTNSEYPFNIDEKSINFDLGVAVGHIGSGDFWLIKDLENYFVNKGYIPSITYFNSFYKYKTDINIVVSGFLPKGKRDIVGRTNILYIAYPMFGNDGKREFVKDIDDYAKEISDLKKDIDAIVVASKSFNDELNKRGIKSYYVSQFTNTDKFFYDYDENLKSEVFFVGVNAFYRKAPHILLEANLPITIYGPNYPQGISKGEYLDNRILRKYYSSAKIVLNDTRDGMKEFGFISNRIFDASACGTLVISDYVKEIEEVYGDSVPMYKTKEELIELVKYYLDPKNEAERLNKAQRAKDITLKNFTADIAGEKFDAIIKEIKKNEI